MYNLKEMLFWGTLFGIMGICAGFLGSFMYCMHIPECGSDQMMNIMWVSGGIWAFIGVLMGTPAVNSYAFLTIVLAILIVVLIIDYVLVLCVLGTLIFSYFKRA